MCRTVVVFDQGIATLSVATHLTLNYNSSPSCCRANDPHDAAPHGKIVVTELDYDLASDFLPDICEGIYN